MYVLFAEDDIQFGTQVCATLTHKDHYQIKWVKDGHAALRAACTEQFDGMAMAVELPEHSGLSVLKTLRAQHIKTPIILMASQQNRIERIKGLDAGADDYLVKPFDLRELSARLRALQRRVMMQQQQGVLHQKQVISYAGIVLIPDSYTLYLNGQPQALSRREFMLMLKLLQNVGCVLSRDQLKQAYGLLDKADGNVIEVHISSLRKKLGYDLIQTVRGEGYVVGASTDAAAPKKI